jgi:hypothetical protein
VERSAVPSWKCVFDRAKRSGGICSFSPSNSFQSKHNRAFEGQVIECQDSSKAGILWSTGRELNPRILVLQTYKGCLCGFVPDSILL